MLGNRRSIRLPEYDYSSDGWYFVTICAQDRELYFNNNDIKQMIENIWVKLPTKFNNIDLDEYIIMPNHVHGIVVILDNDICRGDPCGRPEQRAGTRPAPTIKSKTLGDIIGAFKSKTTHQYIKNIKTQNWPWFANRLWQRNYYERIIRNNQELNRIKNYIINNPANWEFDRNNPKNCLEIKN